MENNELWAARVVHACAQYTRDQIFRESDPGLNVASELIKNRAAAGFVGNNYGQGGMLVLGNAPGGGGEKGASQWAIRDDIMWGKFQNLREVNPANSQLLITVFREVRQCHIEEISRWDLYRKGGLKEMLERCDLQLDAIAYSNIIPFKMNIGKNPSREVQKRAMTLNVEPLLAGLKPSMVVLFGYKTSEWYSQKPIQSSRTHKVKRTNGDKRIAREARAEIAEICEDWHRMREVNGCTDM